MPPKKKTSCPKPDENSSLEVESEQLKKSNMASLDSTANLEVFLYQRLRQQSEQIND